MFYDQFEEQYYNDHAKNCTNYKETLAPIDKWQSCNMDDIIIGDYIYIEYLPSSQKHIYTHVPECGQVINIEYVKCDFTNTNSKHIFIRNHNGCDILINKDGLCMYSSGYDMFIQKKY